MTMTKQNIEIAIIKEKVNKLEVWADNVDNNHFPSIEKRFDGVELKIARWGGGIAALVVLVPLLVKFLIE